MITFVASFLSVTTLTAAADVWVQPDHPAVQFSGRFDRTPAGVRFDMAGAEIRLRVDGAQTVWMHLTHMRADMAESDEAYSCEFAVWVDGIRQAPAAGSFCTVGGAGWRACTFETSGSSTNATVPYLLSSNLTTNKAHDIKVVKLNEARAWTAKGYMSNWVTFAGFELDSGSPAKPLQPLAHRHLEFIGDSVMAGFCNTCQGPMDPTSIHLNGLFVDWTSDAYWRAQLRSGASGESYSAAWPAQLCDLVGAQCHITAQSGTGLLHDCNNGATIDDVWRRTVATDNASVWDFSQWSPDALVVNIGMNDGDRVKTNMWKDKYTALVVDALELYGRHVHVFLACGPVTGRYCVAVKEVVERLMEVGVQAHFLDQRPFLNGTYGGACCGHPGKRVASVIADAAAQAIKKHVKWSGFSVHKDYPIDKEEEMVFQEVDAMIGGISEFDCVAQGNGNHCTQGLLEYMSPGGGLHSGSPHEL